MDRYLRTGNERTSAIVPQPGRARYSHRRPGRVAHPGQKPWAVSAIGGACHPRLTTSFNRHRPRTRGRDENLSVRRDAKAQGSVETRREAELAVVIAVVFEL